MKNQNKEDIKILLIIKYEDYIEDEQRMEDSRNFFEYLLFGIEKRYKNKREVVNKSSKGLERLLKLSGYTILEGAETTIFRAVPFLASAGGFYGIDIRDYKLASSLFGIAALVIMVDFYRFREEELPCRKFLIEKRAINTKGVYSPK